MLAGRTRELPAGLLLGEASLSPPRCRRRVSCRVLTGAGLLEHICVLLGDSGDFGVQDQGQVKSQRYHRGFIFSGASGEAFVLCGCSKELQGQAGRRHWVFGPHAQWIRQGPRGHGLCCSDGGRVPSRRPRPVPWPEGGARSSHPGWKVFPDSCQPVWGPVSRAHCVRKSVWCGVSGGGALGRASWSIGE